MVFLTRSITRYTYSYIILYLIHVGRYSKSITLNSDAKQRTIQKNDNDYLKREVDATVVCCS